ncbi:MAG: hypothetical protein ABWX76_15835 [Leifsonia flava]
MCDAHQNHDAAPAAEHCHPVAEQPAAPACHHSESAVKVKDTGDDTAECPVMRGSFVNKADAEAQGLIREHEDTTYYLCCAACGPLFDADPVKYVAAL